MATSKTFTVAGVSFYKGKFKVRYCNGKAKGRARVLERNGHEHIHFVDMGEPMYKEDCVDRLLDLELPVEGAREAIVAEAKLLGFEQF